MSTVIVGGGPTGVELAGAVAELARGMHQEFRNIDPASARVILVQAAPRLLPTFPEKLSERTEASLTKLGVEVMTGCRVGHIDPPACESVSSSLLVTLSFGRPASSPRQRPIG